MSSYNYSSYYAQHQQQQAPARVTQPIRMTHPQLVAHVHHHELDGIEMKIADRYQRANKVIASLGLMDINQHRSEIEDMEYSFDLERRILEQNGDKRKKLSYD